MPEIIKAAKKDYATLLAEGAGLKGQNFERQAAAGSTAAITGTVYGMLVPFRAGDVVTNVHVNLNAAGASMTLSKVGIYDTSGNRLAASADLTTAWQASGAKTHALSAAYTVPTTGCRYLVLLGVSGSMPQFWRSTAAQSTMTAFSGGSLPFVAEASQTDLDATCTFVVTNSIGYWIGWS